jgi:sugar transferase (PEP-CTERM system associated)
MLLALVEIGIVCLSAYVVYVALLNPNTSNPVFFQGAFFVNLFVLVVFYFVASLSVGLYNNKLRESFRSIVRRIFVVSAMVYSAVALIISNLFPVLYLHQGYIPLTLALTIFLAISFRYFVQDYDALNINKRVIIVIGAGERASLIEKRMRRKVDQKGFNLIGFVPTLGDIQASLIGPEKIIDIDFCNLVEYVIRHKVECIVIASDERRQTLPIEALFECKIRGVEIMDMIDFLEEETGQVAVNLIYPSWVIYSNGFESNNYVRVTLDSVFNAFLATIVLLLTWPIMMLTALLIYLDDGYRTGGSVFYAQERVGLDGIPFKIYKFRSMRPDAEKEGAQWATKNDCRTTRIGAFIRKYRIDELPQLINIYRGEMGFVGPRPERPEFVMELVKRIPYYNQRHNVKPGLTGWAQLKYPYGSTMEDALEKLKYDLYYVKHRSILLDLFILIRTVEIVIFGKGR